MKSIAAACALLWAGLVSALPLVPMPAEISLSKDGSAKPLCKGFKVDLQLDGAAAGCTFVSECTEHFKRLAFGRHAPVREDVEPSTCVQSLVIRGNGGGEEEGDAFCDLDREDLDEAYSLTLKKDGRQMLMTASSGAAVCRGLSTVLQLIEMTIESASGQEKEAFTAQTGRRRFFKIPSEISIRDAPRFPHRGILIDSSRHFLPLPVINRLLDGMLVSKLNVLHWHVIDAQAFPLETRELPKLWEGAYTDMERYSLEDVQEVVEQAKSRGIRVMVELDSPGHVTAWAKTYPQLFPPDGCKGKDALDVTNEDAVRAVEGLLTEFSCGSDNQAPLFGYPLVHLGGDEVNFSCWTSSEAVKERMKERGFDTPEALYDDYVNRLYGFVLKCGGAKQKQRKPVAWDEVLVQTSAPEGTIVHSWRDLKYLKQATEKGFKALNSRGWYLDHLQVDWRSHYEVDLGAPSSLDDFPGLSAEEEKLVLGGEAAMWGESADVSNVEATTWPRTAAVAEKLWSPKAFTLKEASSEEGMNRVGARLQEFRCLFLSLGIPAAPLEGTGRSWPPGPGSCTQAGRAPGMWASPFPPKGEEETNLVVSEI
uniref:beta-N-acetylhexosaminidase n=1 Tax=Chromera velia CCMP2878 TaxID=1169474 RepID=A0A0G4G7J3_9ALVE|mmetsp:Transcript_47548/g.93816  ORF Transcript_47548/g.93816 Transcript_47548/m.93816 type:complete len:593 (-) Transcript_47548:536-2314(-)|eukprot:Cvel_20597.t1-p1 / transcript=Cvel_20597.t1 / gene=Cvel_20597 / organism=Chromera_velia_CCMP2878 / gene_product=Beta-hexosaminidase 3, putative / transcript_product=Beta-hexosaminidase 3, putative / location=Cvel_scaffold1862:18565-24808(-) / protein_length=592 / sequence_SO=supercontig / SO=protein_coding / is_pseudo=false